MKEKIEQILRVKNLVINQYLIKIGIDNNLSLNEFLVLVYLDNDFNNNFDIENMSVVLGLDVNKTMEAFNNLVIKGLVSLESVKDALSKFNEVVNLNKVYEEIASNVEESNKKEVKDDIFKVFESELGRTMSSMELEIINGWLVSGTSEEVVLGALREAIYNGVPKFRYIDKIIYEWEKKGLKTMDDVKRYMSNRRIEKSKDREVTKKEQEILDYDWLDE